MLKRFVAPTMVLAVLMSWPLLITHAQNAPAAKPAAATNQQAAPAAVDPEELETHIDGWGRPVPTKDWHPLNWPTERLNSGPAPRRDISGTWEPARGWRNGVQAWGPDAYQLDGKHPLVPFTRLGDQMWRANKYMDGLGASPYDQVNDPFKLCDPPGFPRVQLQELRGVQIDQSPKRTLVVYQNDQAWRNIWTDGRSFPEINEPRWYGYSIGRWLDDTTFFVETTGMDERTWIDNVGRPHTKDLRVEERFHRVNRDIIELTTTIIDPQLYSRPWNAQDKYPLRLQSDSFDIREMLCSVSEALEYSQHIGEDTKVPR